MNLVELAISCNEKGYLNIHGIPPDELGRKQTIQVLAECIKTITALKPTDSPAILTPSRNIVTP